jgi:hypothetical protein
MTVGMGHEGSSFDMRTVSWQARDCLGEEGRVISHPADPIACLAEFEACGAVPRRVVQRAER